MPANFIQRELFDHFPKRPEHQKKFGIDSRGRVQYVSYST